MEIQFQGLNPVFSVPILIILIFGVLFLTWWSYSYLQSLKPIRRWILILLRSIALIILLLLLFNPFMQIDEIDRQRPVVAVYLDDSKSMGIGRGEYNGWDSYRSIIESFEFDNRDEIVFEFYRFDNQVEPIDDRQLNLEGGITNLDEVMRHIRERSEETVASILFSDGIVTRGRDPLFTARELHIPLFTVPVGDTSETRDVAISELLTNETGYVNTSQPVEITVNQEGFPEESATLQLIQNDEILETEEIQFNSQNSIHRISFQLYFEEPGLHEYSAYIPELDGEITSENNHYPFSINVIDEKTDIFHIAFEIHPDVKAVRSILESDRNIELYPFTWVGNRFLERSPEEIADDPELIVIHGAIPENFNFPDDMITQNPVVQFTTPGVGVNDLESTVIPLNIFNPSSTLDIHLNPVNQNINHPVLELVQIDFNRQPTLSVIRGNYELSPTSIVLLNAVYAGTETDIPVVITEEIGNVRRVLINAHGWFRYTQSRDEPTRNFATNLLSNISAWAATSPESEHLRIESGKLVYQEGEEITFRADLTGETGEPETDAVIEITITDEEAEERSYSMLHRGSGHYYLSSGSMAAGNYQYSAEARKNGRTIDLTTGEFSVTPSTIEFINTRRNDPLLQRLSEVTGGELFISISPTRLIEELDERNLLQEIENRRTVFRFLHEHAAWFIIVLLLLTAEWLLRRKYSLP